MYNPKTLTSKGWRILVDKKPLFVTQIDEDLWVRDLETEAICIASPLWTNIAYPIKQYFAKYQNPMISALLLYVHLHQLTLKMLPAKICLDHYYVLLTMKPKELEEFIQSTRKTEPTKTNMDRDIFAAAPALLPLVNLKSE
jgi:hypothetical protein